MSQSEQPDATERSIAAVTPHYRLLELDDEAALASAEDRLQGEFATMFDFETVHRYLYDSYDDFVARSTVKLYLPTLAERFGRQRLSALAKVQGKVAESKPTVLFLCTDNAGRSQLALGMFTQLAQGRAIAWSGGSESGAALNPAAVEAMAEVGIDIADEYPKPWTDEIIRAADVIVSMGCGDICPRVPGPRYDEWIIEDPAGLGIDEVRPIRDDIAARVENLLADLGLPLVDRLRG
ncbi:arsenate reductase ArsC [Nocardia sp. NPDC005998]|uniref:arsenate reductase ArsC n=1 Tax=Nocardia sp. NPDC005998 TaxID=3156894 RepID=UPI0033B38827